MDKANVQGTPWRVAKRVAALAITMLLIWYAAVNLVLRWPYFQFAVDTGWSFASTAANLDRVANGQGIGQEAMLDAHASLQQALHKRASNGLQVVRGDSGELNYTNFYPYETYDYRVYGERLRALSDATQAQGGNFMFITTANANRSGNDDAGGIPVADFSARADALAYYLQGFGVPHIDTHSLLEQTGLPQWQYRYKTSPLWTARTCYLAMDGILQSLRDTFGIELDLQGHYLSDASFVETVYPDATVGEFGRLTGIPFSGLDDFTLITPAFETDFTLTATHYGRDMEARGSFDEVLVASQNLTDTDPYARAMDGVYLGGLAPRRVIENHLAPGGLKVLLIGDNSTPPLAAFIAPMARELHYLWSYENPTVPSLQSYIEANGFDLVLMALSPASISEGGLSLLTQF